MAGIYTPANKKPRDYSSLEVQLARQLKYIDISAAHFDQGDEEEAGRLATAIRVLVHDTGSSTSLLKQLGLKDKLRFIDTGFYRDRLNQAADAYVQRMYPGLTSVATNVGEAGLVEVGQNADGSFGWKPPLRKMRVHPNDPKAAAMLPPQEFEYWWSTPLVEASSLKLFSRKDLVLIMVNQDGGAHVDPGLDADYADLCVDNLGVSKRMGTPGEVFDVRAPLPPVGNNVAFASVRQIAFEVVTTLQEYFDANQPSERES